MIGILVALAISWGLLYFFEKKSLLALGVLPLSTRLIEFGTGFLITFLLCISLQVYEAYLKSSQWFLNDEINGNQILNMFYWDLKSVLTEELIFRGAILYILIKKLGTVKAIVISAITFGVYHWFSFGIIGSVIPMIVVFIGTGLTGYAWALAFAKTESIAMPIGLHLGWNFTLNTIFSKGPLGEGLLLLESNQVISDWYSLIGLWLMPLVVWLIVKYFIPARNMEFIK